jgi:hypothetical protein
MQSNEDCSEGSLHRSAAALSQHCGLTCATSARGQIEKEIDPRATVYSKSLGASGAGAFFGSLAAQAFRATSQRRSEGETLRTGREHISDLHPYLTMGEIGPGQDSAASPLLPIRLRNP